MCSTGATRQVILVGTSNTSGTGPGRVNAAVLYATCLAAVGARGVSICQIETGIASVTLQD
jgi:hypothetical protein